MAILVLSQLPSSPPSRIAKFSPHPWNALYLRLQLPSFSTYKNCPFPPSMHCLISPPQWIAIFPSLQELPSFFPFRNSFFLPFQNLFLKNCLLSPHQRTAILLPFEDMCSFGSSLWFILVWDLLVRNPEPTFTVEVEVSWIFKLTANMCCACTRRQRRGPYM